MQIKIRDEAHRAEIEARIAELKVNLDRGGYPSADAYHQDKDLYWDLCAALKNTTSMQLNPMNFWFGRQSN